MPPLRSLLLIPVLGLVLVADKTDSPWTLLSVPGAWEETSDGKLANHDGTAWYRTFVLVPEKWQGQDLELLLRQIDDADEAYFNGEKVGATGAFPPRFQSASQADRRYRVPARLVRPGKLNLIALRVHDGGGQGGLVGGTPLLRAGKEALRLDGQWQFRTGDDLAWAKWSAEAEAEAYRKAARSVPGHRGVEDYFTLARQGDRLVDALEGTQGLDEVLRIKLAKVSGGKPLPPPESLKSFRSPEDVRIDLVLSEPTVRQPLNITFDERGRLWVVQYIQYPFPAGLKIVSYDRYIRAKFDKVPPPPPKHFRGADRITIHEDKDGDGVFEKTSTFQDGLSIATSVLPGRGGVWVLNPPYLLFYPDRNRDDIPDGDPVVHLSGFGLEDTHAVASSLVWGPDGWIYGSQGSTCTAKVKVEIKNDPKTTDFLGQAIWRYHPEKHVFELYAEGGGNTFGVAFDNEGRLYSGTNWGQYRGLHYVQGGYYVKGWGKHGPLTNPHAYGFFQHMTHTGNADRLTHTFTVYGGTSLPERFRNRIIGPSPLQKRLQVTRLESELSTYRTVEEPFLVTTTDGWFRPVDCKEGPDGGLYVADFYENRIDHVDPRDTWHRDSGRVYRIQARDAKAIPSFDLGRASSAELVKQLSHTDRWYRWTALRLLGDRKDRSVLPALRRMLKQNEGQAALETLWALHQSAGLAEEDALAGLAHRNPSVRRWTVRLLGDERDVSPGLARKLATLAETEKDAQVRSQLASSAKRLPGSSALPIVKTLLQRDEDFRDPHIPLLLWWAVEAHAATDRAGILSLFEDAALWRKPLVDGVILERLMQRYASAGGKEDLLACARLLKLAPEARQVEKLLAGLDASLAGGSSTQLPEDLKAVVARNWNAGSGGGRLALGVRVGIDEAVNTVLAQVRDEKTDRKRRLDHIRLLGEVDQPRSVPVLLEVCEKSSALEIRQAVLASLQRYDDPRIPARALEWYTAKDASAELLTSLQTLLTSRASWALQFLRAIEANRINPRSIPLDVVRRLKQHAQPEVAALVSKHWGKVRESTPAEKAKEIERLAGILKGGNGNPLAGKVVFSNTCGKCHKMFGEGGNVGPELTGYERDNVGFWLENVIDPSAAIRDEFTNFLVETTDGRQLAGLIVEQNKQTVTLRTADGQTVRLARERIEDLKASQVSIMPDDQMKALTEQQIRDLFAFLRAKSQPR